MTNRAPHMVRWLIGAFAISTLVFTCAARYDASTGASRSRRSESSDHRGERVPQVTFTRDIAPILFRSCAPCHHPGEAAPFALLSYADAKTHARQIAAVTQARIM